MFKKIITLSFVFILASCSQNNIENNQSLMFDKWQFNEETCTLESNSNGMNIKTNGRISAELIYFKISSPYPLARTPTVSANNMETLPIRVEGTGKYFSFEILYTPYVVARLINENSFFVVDYRIQNIQKPKKELFNTKGLANGLKYLSEYCL